MSFHTSVAHFIHYSNKTMRVHVPTGKKQNDNNSHRHMSIIMKRSPFACSLHSLGMCLSVCTPTHTYIVNVNPWVKTYHPNKFVAFFPTDNCIAICFNDYISEHTTSRNFPLHRTNVANKLNS